LALDPPLLFLDEPSAGLDPVTSAELDDLIATLNASLGMTTVIVTHELRSIFAIVKHCIMLDGPGARDHRAGRARGAPRRKRRAAGPRLLQPPGTGRVRWRPRPPTTGKLGLFVLLAVGVTLGTLSGSAHDGSGASRSGDQLLRRVGAGPRRGLAGQVPGRDRRHGQRHHDRADHRHVQVTAGMYVDARS